MSSSQNSARSIIASSKVLDDEIYKLQNFANTANEKNLQLREIAEQTANRLETIGRQISGNTDVLKVKAIETMETFNQVSGSLKSNTMSMLEVASQISAHAKKSDASLAKQAGNLENCAKDIKGSEQALLHINEILQDSTEKLATALAYYEKSIKNLKK